MLNYMNSEFYRLIRDRGYWIMMVVCCALLAFVAFIASPFNQDFIFSILTSSLVILLAFPITMMSSFASNEEKEQTIRHAVAFGIGRTKIYVARILVHMLFCVFAYVAIIAFTTVVSGIFSGFDWTMLEQVWAIYASVIPLYLSAAALEYGLLMYLPSAGVAQATGYGITWLLPFLLMNFGMKYPLLYKVYTLFPMAILSEDLYAFTQSRLWVTAGLGLLYTVVLILIGNYLFKRREY